METDPDNWPIYHGMIKADESETRLRHDNRVGAFLVRYAGGDYILSYIKDGSNIKHIKLAFSQDTNLRKCHPGITDIRKTVEFITGLKMHFLYPVACTEFGEAEENSCFRREPLTCHICDKPFKEKAELLIHLRTHRISYCEVCNDIVPAASFKNHKAKCHAPSTPLLRCGICNVYETHQKRHLKQHMQQKHGEHSVQCYVCDKHFKDQSACQNHMRTVHTGIPCHTCGKKFKSNYHRNRHIARVHEQHDESEESDNNSSSSPDSQSTVDCPSPMPSTPPAPSVLTSTPSHSLAPPPHFCLNDDAGSGDDPGGGLLPPHDEHLHDQCATHDGDLHDQCHSHDGHLHDQCHSHDGHLHDQCNSSFEDIEPGEHESNVNSRKFKCRFCKYDGNSKKKLKRHIKRCHPDGPPPLIECEFCPEFKTKYPKNLARHMEKSCPGLKDFCVLSGDTLWEVLTEINISNNQSYKLLSLLKKKLGKGSLKRKKVGIEF